MLIRHPLRMPLTFLFLLAGIPLTGSPGARAATNHPTLEVPFEITSNKPWVQVRVNGSAPRWFILDTGCRISSLIERGCAEELGLALDEIDKGAELGGGQGHRVRLASTANVILDVRGDTLHAPSLLVVTLDHVMPYEGRRVDGLLGGDFMERHVVELDYAHSVMRLYDPQTYHPSGRSKPIPITLDDGLARAAARMVTPKGDTLHCQVVVDTGVRGTVIWYRPFVLANHLLESQDHVITGTIGGGVGGETRGDIGRLASLTVGPLRLDHPPVIFSRDTTGVFAGTDAAGIVGGETLRRCKVTFDYPHHQLFLEPYANPVADLEYDMSGLFLVADPPELKRIRVQSVADGTPASEAGLLRGDLIVTIDGRGVEALTLDQVREMFKKAGASYRLGLVREGRELSVGLTMRRLV